MFPKYYNHLSLFNTSANPEIQLSERWPDKIPVEEAQKNKNIVSVEGPEKFS